MIDMHCNLLTNSRSRGIPVTFFLCVDSVLCSTAGGDIKLIKINGVNQQDESLSNLTFILYEMMRISYYPENLSFLINVEIFWRFLKVSSSRA